LRRPIPVRARSDSRRVIDVSRWSSAAARHALTPPVGSPLSRLYNCTSILSAFSGATHLSSPELRERLEHSLADRYTLERELGRGGMAVVYLAHDKRHDRKVALKVMHEDLSFALGRERFLREIRVAARLSHPHVVTVHDSGEAAGLLYYVMPYVDGESLRSRLERETRLPVADAVHIAREVGDALGYAHANGIVHRDIKPENILLSGGHAFVADFGIASAVDVAREERITATGVSLGTPAYMSPEQALGETIDARSDVWGLGCVLYEMLSGAPPFGTQPKQVLAKILTDAKPSALTTRAGTPRAISDVVTAALARKVDDRIASGHAFVDALNNGVVLRKRTRPLGAAMIASAALVVLIAGFLFRSRGGPSTSVSEIHRNSASAVTGRLSADSIANQLYLRGRSQYARGTNVSTENGISLFTQAIKRDSTFSIAWAGLSKSAVFAWQRGFKIRGIPHDSLLTLAVNASDRALDIDSTSAENWVAHARAVHYADPTVSAPAITALERAIRLDSSYSEAWADLALRRQEMLDDKGAEEAWLKAIALNPRNFTALAFYSIHFQWNGQYARGVQWADSALAVEPTYVLARESAGQLALALGRLDEAERHFQAYTRVTSGREQVNGLCGLAELAARRGNMKLARAYTQRAASLSDIHNPTLHEAAVIGAALAATGDTARALRLLFAYSPRADVHYQLHLKRDPGLAWLRGPLGKGLLTGGS
jgi:serine/threonine protein kinase/Tfp pilus assembly protein PilF